MELTEDEILSIMKILSESDFDELRLEAGDLKLVLSKAGAVDVGLKEAPSRRERGASKPVTTVGEEVLEVKSAAQKIEAAPASTAEEGLVPIKAPMMGTFYARPEPGSPPYVEVGKLVTEDDTVCLLEVMKVFTAVKAGMQGRITEVCVESGQLVEYGQQLFLVKPEESLRTDKK